MEGCPEEIAKLGEIQTGVQDVEPKKYPLSLASMELLKSHGSGLNGERIHEPRLEPLSMKEPTTRLSTEDIMRIAGQRFIQSSSQEVDVMPMLGYPFDLSFSGLSSEEIEDIELVDILLASAEKVSKREFERAGRLLRQCDWVSSKTGNPVQRVVYHFSEALHVKIDRGSMGSGNKVSTKDIFEVVMRPSSVAVAYRQQVPFCQVEQFAGIQAIVENVAEAKKVHIIDLGLKYGVQWTALMQALATRHECPLELLKITAVGTSSKEIEDSGKWLVGFAQNINLPFSFMVASISDVLDLKKDQFKLDDEEATAVYCEFFLWTMIGQPGLLDSLMGVIRKIKPCIMVVIEVESNINSPDFVSRFIEDLFYAGAYFDCFEACMERDAINRFILESIFGQAMKNIIVSEGEERRVRHVKIDVWRAFFSRFGMEETYLSMSSLFQADQMVKNFGREKSCTLDMNGKSLIIGWKGTQLHSLSIWKFL
ncbi:DELLA protein RGL1-like [Tripterygium wilfordii]|uniref:DELLA protein RGL1-like n=1 Tax=Tripterygium wilfordii TaxID=458696 RepID=UPI0018F81856|nr:DELLA protein RGL1-like [Tripterygium wilfordii]